MQVYHKYYKCLAIMELSYKLIIMVNYGVENFNIITSAS